MILLATAELLILSREAYAYLDPGTGSYLMQMVLAVILGALFAIRIFWQKVTDSIKRLAGSAKNSLKKGGDKEL